MLATCLPPLPRSWNYFRCEINETLIKQVADAMVATGLREAGYKYVNIGGHKCGLHVGLGTQKRDQRNILRRSLAAPLPASVCVLGLKGLEARGCVRLC